VDKIGRDRLVGPVMRGFDGEMIEAVIAAAEIDNPGQEISVDDRGGYVRVHAPGRFRLTRATMEQMLGRSFPLSELEPSLSAFAGHILQGDDELIWSLKN
jgi:toluene monooxygenase system protein D